MSNPKFEVVEDFPGHFDRVKSNESFHRLGCIGCRHGNVIKITDSTAKIDSFISASMGEFPKPHERLNQGARVGQTDLCEPSDCKYVDRIDRAKEEINVKFGIEV